MKKRTFIATRTILLFIILTSCIVSLATLSKLSIRLDEAQSIWDATKSVPEIIQIIVQDVHVPLYELILHVWIQLFGNNILAARLLSFLFFLATLPVLYVVTKRVSDRLVAYLTITFFSLSPFIMWYSSEARMYTLFTFITSLHHWFFLQLIDTNGKKGKFGFFLVTIFGFYTHYFFIFLLLTQGIFLIIRAILQRFDKQQFQKIFPTVLYPQFHRLLFLYIGLVFCSGLFFLPWIVYFIATGAASNTQPLIPPPTSFNIFQAFLNFLFGFQASGIQSLFIALWPLLVLILFFVFTRRQKKHVEYIEYFVLSTFLPIILVFLASFLKPIFLTRYLILVTPTLFLLLAWFLTSYSRRVSGFIISVLLLSMFGLLLYQNISSNTPVKEDYTGVTKYLASHVSPSDIIAVSAPFTIYPIEYSYTGSAKISTIPLWDRYQQGAIPAFSVNSLQTQLTSYKTQYDHLYVVLSYDQGYEKTIRHYLDTHLQMVTHKQFSPGLEVREYVLRYYSTPKTENQ